MNKKFLNLVIPLCAVLVASFLAFTTMDKKVFDFFQRPLKSTVQNKHVVMINIDDATIDKVGTWPLDRDVYAESLIVMKLLGIKDVVFDLSFLDKSSAKIDETYVTQELPVHIINEFQRYDGTEEILAYIQENVMNSVASVIKPVDRLFAQSIGFFGNTILCFSFDDSASVSPEQEQALETVRLKNITVMEDNITPEYSGAHTALEELLYSSAAAGFVNADTDSDGYLRRLQPVIKYKDNYYGQLALVSMLDYLGNPEVVVTGEKIVLKNAAIPGEEVRDIVIPRSEDGSVILKYPKTKYNQYNAVSFWNIYRVSILEKNLKTLLSELNENGFFYYCDDNPFDWFNAYEYIKGELYEGENPDFGISYEDCFAYRKTCLESTALFLDEEIKNTILGDVAGDRELEDYVNLKFNQLEETYFAIVQAESELRSLLENSVCIIGTTATSTSDFGVIQYEDGYPNPGCHYTFANMILSQDFVDDCPLWVELILALVLAVGYSLCLVKIKGTTRKIIFGVIYICTTALLNLGFFMATRIYAGFVIPEVALLLDFIASTVLGFMTASKERKFITNAFSQCLSKTVVNEIVANPSSFKLGGQKLQMTAIFTDIQKFSSFSELLSASQLVALLNYYLTRMSDIIMDLRGTVDKYEGDAIIALVGAPIKMEDHAQRAVLAALKMKKAEKEMNEEIKRIASGPKPEGMEDDLYDSFCIMVKNGKQIFTRIGLNSGEMIAGYMGSENKKNYTMMGNNVNLASRLEGVNKQYSTGGILCSEATRNLLGDEFVVRSLDRVRVVNVNTPIRLYEPLCRKDDADEKILARVARWENAMKLFEEASYKNPDSYLVPLEEFQRLRDENPGDGVAEYYAGIIEKFFATGRYPVEADGIGVEYNPEDGVFKLLQK